MSKSKRVVLSPNMKVALYCRVACESDEAIKNQEIMLRVYAEEQGFGDVSVYTDNGVSGSGFDRPAFNRLNEDISAGCVAAVIVKDLARIGRNAFEIPNWIDGVRRKGVSFISVMDGINDDTFDGKSNAIYQLSRNFLRKQRKKPPRHAAVDAE